MKFIIKKQLYVLFINYCTWVQCVKCSNVDILHVAAARRNLPTANTRVMFMS